LFDATPTTAIYPLSLHDALPIYEWLDSRDDAILRTIADYNEEDCRSTFALREWLVGLRPPGVAWREPPEVRTPKPEAAEALAEREQMRAELLARGDELTAQLLDYHRREAKPAGWWFFG